jgi:predicted PurR-regulated permease PerM
MKADSHRQPTQQPVSIGFAFKLLCLFFAFLIVAYIAWQAFDVLLILFAGTLGAIVLTRLSNWITQKTHWRYPLVLTLVLLGLLGLVVFASWNIAPEINRQLPEFISRMSEMIDRLGQQLQQYAWVEKLFASQVDWGRLIPDSSKAIRTATGVFSATFGMLGTLVLIIALSIFLAVNPRIYIQGFLQLLPPQKRAHSGEVLSQTGNILAAWLFSKFIAMLFIGGITALGLWLIGVPYALTLAVIAGLLSFIPNIGPVLALIPALLVALMQGVSTTLWVAGLYVGIQFFETYFLTPYLQQEVVEIPPGFALIMQVLLGVMAGVLGVVLAVPITAAGMVVVRMLYVEDYLERRNSAA